MRKTYQNWLALALALTMLLSLLAACGGNSQNNGANDQQTNSQQTEERQAGDNDSQTADQTGDTQQPPRTRRPSLRWCPRASCPWTTPRTSPSSSMRTAAA